MKIDGYKVFSVMKNITTRFEKGKKVKNLDAGVYRKWYDNTTDYLKKRALSVSQEINNGHFSYYDYKVFILDNFLFESKVDWALSTREIPKFMKKYSDNQLKKDKEFILSLKEKIDFNGIEDLFQIDENGESMIYRLVINRYVSPYFCVKFMNNRELNIEEETDSHKLFWEIIEELKQTVKKVKQNNSRRRK